MFHKLQWHAKRMMRGLGVSCVHVYTYMREHMRVSKSDDMNFYHTRWQYFGEEGQDICILKLSREIICMPEFPHTLEEEKPILA